MKVSLRIKRMFREPPRDDDLVLDGIEIETAVRLNTALHGQQHPDLDTVILVDSAAGAGRPSGGWLARRLAGWSAWFRPAPPPDALPPNALKWAD